jgi:hypothetical protein
MRGSEQHAHNPNSKEQLKCAYFLFDSVALNEVKCSK